MRYSLLNLLLETERDAEAAALLKQFDDGMADGTTRARCWPSVSSGRQVAERRLAGALKHNQFVPAYLTARAYPEMKLPAVLRHW